MPRRSVAIHTPDAAVSGLGELVSEDDVRRAAAAAKVRIRDAAAAASALHQAFVGYLLAVQSERANAPSALARWAESVANAAARLRKELETGSAEHFRPIFGAAGDELDRALLAFAFHMRRAVRGSAVPSDASAFTAALAAVPVIERGARLLSAHWRNERRSARRSGRAEKALVCEMARIFEAQTGRRATVVVPRDRERPKPEGAILGWCATILREAAARVGSVANMTAHARHAAWRLRALAGSPNALAHRLRAKGSRTA